MLKSYPDGNVKVFFLLHTNKEGSPATKPADAGVWDKRLKLKTQRYASTLVDKGREGFKTYFAEQKTGNMVLKRGFEVHAIDVENIAQAVKAAMDAG